MKKKFKPSDPQQYHKEVAQREALLLVLVANRTKAIAEKYPATKGMIEDLNADIIALVIDWDTN